MMVKSRSSFWTLSATVHLLVKSNATTYMTRSDAWLLALLPNCVQRCISHSLLGKLTLALLFALFLNSWRLLSQHLVPWVVDAVIWKHEWCCWFLLVNSGWLLSGFTSFLDQIVCMATYLLVYSSNAWLRWKKHWRVMIVFDKISSNCLWVFEYFEAIGTCLRDHFVSDLFWF